MPAETVVIIPSVNILNASLDPQSNSVLCQIGDVQNEDPEDYQVQWVQQSGFASLPPNAIPNQTAGEGIMLKTSYNSFVFACRDYTSQANYGNLSAGEVSIYAAGPTGTGQARVQCKADGSVSLITTSDNTASTPNVGLNITPTGFYVNYPFGKIALDAAGFRVTTSSGASMSLMTTSDPTTGNAFMVTCGNATISANIITLGNPVNTAVPFGVAYGVLPAPAPGIPILGAGVGLVTVAAASSTSVFVGI